MHDPLDELKQAWWQDRKTELPQPLNTDRIISLAHKKKHQAIGVQAGNILVLLLTLLGISAFFRYVAPLQQVISHIGIGLMIGGLALRILIELLSIYRAGKVDLSDTTRNANEAFLQYYQFRRRIHGPITITILALYTVGFYLLTPEFSDYFSLTMLVLIDLSYILAAIIFTHFIRLGIRREMDHLREIRRLQKDMVAQE